MLYVLSINLGTPLFRLLKGFGTSASAAKWGPANGRTEGGRGRPSGGAESGFAAIIRRAWSIVGRSASGAKFGAQQTRHKRGEERSVAMAGVDKGTYAYSL